MCHLIQKPSHSAPLRHFGDSPWISNREKQQKQNLLTLALYSSTVTQVQGNQSMGSFICLKGNLYHSDLVTVLILPPQAKGTTLSTS